MGKGAVPAAGRRQSPREEEMAEESHLPFHRMKIRYRLTHCCQIRRSPTHLMIHLNPYRDCLLRTWAVIERERWDAGGRHPQGRAPGRPSTAVSRA